MPQDSCTNASCSKEIVPIVMWCRRPDSLDCAAGLRIGRACVLFRDETAPIIVGKEQKARHCIWNVDLVQSTAAESGPDGNIQEHHGGHCGLEPLRQTEKFTRRGNLHGAMKRTAQHPARFVEIVGKPACSIVEKASLDRYEMPSLADGSEQSRTTNSQPVWPEGRARMKAQAFRSTGEASAVQIGGGERPGNGRGLVPNFEGD